MNSVSSAMNRIFRFYYDGFRSMSWWGKRVWIIILIKLFVMFIILKIFFFQDFLQNRYDTDEQKSEYVLDQLINSK
jgi:Na+/H+ antiporter NhaD/arsenite permease-like protein